MFFIVSLLFASFTYASEEKSTDASYQEPENQSLSEEEKESILITEFYPAPDTSNGEKEWVEIYNGNNKKVELNEWFIDDELEGGSKPKSFSVTIPSKSYFVFELGSAILNNTGDDVVLLDENKNAVHIVSYKETVKGSSIQKLSNNEWYITSEITKGEENLEFKDTQSEKPEVKGELSEGEEYDKPDEDKTLSNEEKENIYITEFMPAPDGDPEWVELFNNNDTKVVLENWFIDDYLDEGGKPETFSVEIDAKGYAVIELSKYLLNNTEDEVSLLDENKFPLKIVKYKKTVKGSSIQKLSNDTWYVTAENTKGEENLQYIEPSGDKPKEEETDLSTLEDLSDLNKESELEENDIQEGVTGLEVKEEGEDSDTLDNQNEDVLGLNEEVEFKTINVYKPESVFTPSGREGRVYVLTEKDEPNPFEVLYAFIEKAFW